jgi:hypothetical protein
MLQETKMVEFILPSIAVKPDEQREEQGLTFRHTREKLYFSGVVGHPAHDKHLKAASLSPTLLPKSSQLCNTRKLQVILYHTSSLISHL